MRESQPLCLNDAESAVRIALGLVEGGSTCAIEVPSGMFVRHYRATVLRMAPSEEVAKRIRIIVKARGPS